MKEVLKLFQMSWSTGRVPIGWKQAEVKFLRKHGKKSYHDPGAYRPISLTSYLCKCMERIVTSRLYGFAEHFKLLDKEQEGFRKFRGTQDALLRLTQDIYNGFNKNEHTAALFIDIEKAYDSVWRDGLMVKLKEMGITGRIWHWIRNFLTDRSATINMSGVKGVDFCTEIGLPQGSVISPLLFSLFIADWYQNVRCENVKFADDGTVWMSGKDWHELMETLKEDFKEIIQWATKWRLKLSIVKTEFCMFSLDNQVLEEARDFNFVIADQVVKYNSNPKLLGVTLDEKLKFEKHIEQVERKALRSLDTLRKVKETEIISTNCMLQLYKALVIPQLEYAVPVWQIGNCSCLEKIQRKGLALCMGIPGTAGLEALEVEAGVKPLELRREELAVRQAAKIMAKENDSCIKSSWDRFVDMDMVERKISPFGKMNLQVADMISNTGISLHCLEKEVTFTESLQPSKRKPEYWQNLGSSKARSKVQEAQSREIVGTMIENCNEKTAIAFTDGSCLGNPGPCGAGACLYLPGHTEPILLKYPISSYGSILLGELMAIKMAITHIQNRTRSELRIIEKLHIFSDSQCAIGHLLLGWEAKSHKSTIREVKTNIKNLEVLGIKVEISWTPGHSDIKGNEYADQLAKEAAEEAKEKKDLPAVITMGDVKTAARESGKKKWQDMWEKSEKGRTL
ncbi:MAG: reverse transcriptase domain-containing protein, partial [Candidatus Thiodiazotropha sp.]